jgi:chromosome segregation ATPase
MSSPEYAELVRFLGQRFSSIDQRFDAIDQRFDAIDQRFAAIDRRFDAVGQRFDALDRRFDEFRAEVLGHFDEIYRRLERLEQEYQAITQALRRIEGRLVDERTRREVLERDLATLRENIAVLNARIADIEQRLRSSS